MQHTSNSVCTDSLMRVFLAVRSVHPRAYIVKRSHSQ